MATKKREIYARMATQLRHHERSTIAEKACPGAMGLYAFLMMQARGEETRGDTLEDVAYASWGAPTAYRKKQAAALIKAGLIAHEGDRLVIVKYLDHNDGPEDIASAREATRRRVSTYRSATHVTRYTSVTDAHGNADVPISISCSISDSDLESRSRDPDSSPRATTSADNDAPPGLADLAAPVALAVPDAMAAPPDWWDAVIATLEASTGVRLPERATWLSYAGHRASKRRPAERNDALYWLNQVKVPEERERLRREVRDRDRDAKYDAERRQQRSGPEMPKQTPEQARREAQRFAAQIAARKGVA